MPCERIKAADGSLIIVCSRGPRARPTCRWCSEKAPMVCDWPMIDHERQLADRLAPLAAPGLPVVGAPLKTCDAPVCRAHAWRPRDAHGQALLVLAMKASGLPFDSADLQLCPDCRREFEASPPTFEGVIWRHKPSGKVGFLATTGVKARFMFVETTGVPVDVDDLPSLTTWPVDPSTFNEYERAGL